MYTHVHGFHTVSSAACVPSPLLYTHSSHTVSSYACAYMCVLSRCNCTVAAALTVTQSAARLPAARLLFVFACCLTFSSFFLSFLCYSTLSLTLSLSLSLSLSLPPRYTCIHLCVCVSTYACVLDRNALLHSVYEQGGCASVAGVHPRVVRTQKDGTLALSVSRRKIAS